MYQSTGDSDGCYPVTVVFLSDLPAANQRPVFGWAVIQLGSDLCYYRLESVKKCLCCLTVEEEQRESLYLDGTSLLVQNKPKYFEESFKNWTLRNLNPDILRI